MDEINLIYNNNFGVAFKYNGDSEQHGNKVQLVFRDTGLFVSQQELIQFSKNINQSAENHSLCGSCKKKEVCRSILVESHVPQISFAMNTEELISVKDLVEGTLFQLGLDSYLDSLINN